LIAEFFRAAIRGLSLPLFFRIFPTVTPRLGCGDGEKENILFSQNPLFGAYLLILQKIIVFENLFPLTILS
jgi:hypothetical protein